MSMSGRNSAGGYCTCSTLDERHRRTSRQGGRAPPCSYLLKWMLPDLADPDTTKLSHMPAAT
jgi:hypothetical protein